MKNIILYGAPAAGKGTQCELLKEKYGYTHISMGQLFRDLDDSTELGRKIHETIANGILIDDETTAKLLQNKLEELGNVHVVLDGFPRTLNQAKVLDNFFENYVVVNLEVDEELARKRVLGRLNCDNCGKIYNIYFEDKSPKEINKCDACGAKLSARQDDNAESFKNRFNIYVNNVKDILDFYNNKNVLYNVASIDALETFNDIEKILNGGD